MRQVYPISIPELGEVEPGFRRVIEPIYEKAPSCSEAPILLNIGGIPGSGKSTLVERMAKELPSFTVIRFDTLMMSHPGYQEDCATSSEKAFAKYEMPARAAGYVLLKMLLDKRADILFEYSATTNDHLRFMIYCNRIGYQTVLARIQADPEIAKARILEREKSQDRHTPLQLVDERLRLIRRMEKRYRTAVHLFRDIDNYQNVTIDDDIFSLSIVRNLLTDITDLRQTPQRKGSQIVRPVLPPQALESAGEGQAA